MLRPFGFNKAAAAGGITVEGTVGQSVASGASTVDVTIPGTPAENDIVEVIMSHDDSASLQTAVSGYTEIDFLLSSAVLYAGYKRMTATPDTVVTVSQLPKGTAVVVRLLRGVDTTTALDVNDSNMTGGTGTTATPPALTTVTDGALVTVVAALDDDPSVSVSSYPSGYSDTVFTDAGEASGDNSNLAVASKIVATFGLETPGDFVFDSDDAHSAASWAWRPA